VSSANHPCLIFNDLITHQMTDRCMYNLMRGLVISKMTSIALVRERSFVKGRKGCAACAEDIRQNPMTLYTQSLAIKYISTYMVWCRVYPQSSRNHNV
jgi:hypothetical protein